MSETPWWALDLESSPPSADGAALRRALGLAAGARLALSRARELEQSYVAELALPDGRALLLKRTSVAWLKRRFAGKSDERWSVSLRSFGNELAFWRAAALAPGALARLRAAGCAVPRPIFVGGAAPPAEAAGAAAEAGPDAGLGGATRERHVFTSVVELLPPERFRELRNFDGAHARRVLEWLAALHATYWGAGAGAGTGAAAAGGDSDAAAGPGLGALFRPGCWWRKQLRPAVRYESLPEVFADHCAALPAYAAAGLRSNDAQQLDDMRWLAARADALHRHCAAAPAPTTLLHGDLKSSNFFFAERPEDGGDQDTAIDFQWCGWGRGAADVAYVLAGSVAFDALDEAALLAHYHAALSRRLPAAVAPSRAELQGAYEEELCAYWATTLPYLLSDLTPELCVANRAKHGFLTNEDDERVAAHFSARVLGIVRAWRAEGRFPTSS